jgi:metal-responsive CopG/Arc/MetJ family transcriptional regulator
MVMDEVQRFSLSLTTALVERIDEWRRQQPKLASRAEAIRELLELGLSVGEKK